MFKRLLFICGLFFTIFTSPFEAQAQLSGTVSIIGRASSKTSDWTGISRKNRILVTLVNTRLQTYQGVLRVSISNGSGTQIVQTIDDQQTLLQVGIGSTLLDLEEVIAKNEGTFTFTDEALKEKLKNGFIPEDNYQICVDFLDVSNKKTLLNAPICRMVNVIAYQAPILVFPTDKSDIQPNTRPILRWNGVSPRPIGTVNYRLQVFEIVGEQTPEIAFRSNVAIVTELISNQTQWIWSASYPLPKNGKSYAWSVKAIDDEGNPIGETNGQAPPFLFSLLMTEAEKKAQIEAQEKEKEVQAEKNKVVFSLVALNKATNLPIDKASIKVKNILQKTDLSIETGTDGRFTSNKIQADDYEVEISAKGFETEKRTLTVNKDTRDVRIALNSTPIEMKGIIVSKHNNRPLSEVTVELVRSISRNKTGADGKVIFANGNTVRERVDEVLGAFKTEADGRFSFKDLQQGDYTIRTKKKLYEDYKDDRVSIKVGDALKDLGNVAIGNDVMGMMYGRIVVTTRNQQRMVGQNIDVMLLSPGDFRRLVDGGTPQKPIKPTKNTGTDGGCTFEEVPALAEGEQGYVVVTSETDEYDLAHESGITIFKQNDEKRIQLNLKTAMTQFSGIVTDDDGEPLPNAKVEIYSEDNRKIFKSTTTDEKGKYVVGDALRVAYGDVTFSMTGVQSKNVRGAFSTPRRTQKLDTKLSVFIDVRGIVKNQFGNPLPNVKIEIDGKTATTDVKGAYEIKQTSPNKSKIAKLSLDRLSKDEKFTVRSGVSYEYNAVLKLPKKRVDVNVIHEDGKYVTDRFELVIALTSPNNANSKTAGKGKDFFSKQVEWHNGEKLTLDLPEGYEGQALEIRVNNKSLKASAVFLEIPKDADQFVSELSTVTLNMKAFSASVFGIVAKRADKTPIEGAIVKLKGRNLSATTDARGQYTFADLKPASKYEIEVEAKELESLSQSVSATLFPFEGNQTLELNFAMRAFQADVSSIFAKNTATTSGQTDTQKQANSLQKREQLTQEQIVVEKATPMIFGFKADLNRTEKTSNPDVFLLEGFLIVDDKQKIKLISGSTTKLPFENLYFNAKTQKVCNQSGTDISEFSLGEELPIVLNEDLRVEIIKPVIKEGIITGESYMIGKLQTDDLEITKIELIAKNGDKTGIKVKPDDVMPDFEVKSIGGKSVETAIIKIGEYDFAVKEASFDNEGNFNSGVNNYEINLTGGFAFKKSPYDDGGKLGIGLYNFIAKGNKAKMQLAGTVYMGAAPVALGGALAYSNGLVIQDVRAVFRTGLIQASLNAFAEEPMFISKTGKASDLVLYANEVDKSDDIKEIFGGAGEKNKIRSGLTTNRQEAKVEAVEMEGSKGLNKAGKIATNYLNEKLDSASSSLGKSNAEVRKFFAGEVSIKSITARSDQENTLTMHVNGDIRFELFEKGIQITEFSINSKKVVKFTASKTNPTLSNPNDRGKISKEVTNANGSKTEKVSPLSLEFESVTARLDLENITNSVFSIKGKIALGIPSMRVKVGEIVIGGSSWGGSLGIEGGTKAWAASGEIKYVYAKENLGTIRKGHNIGGAGMLWFGRDGSQQYITGTTLNKTTGVSSITREKNDKEIMLHFGLNVSAPDWSIYFRGGTGEKLENVKIPTAQELQTQRVANATEALKNAKTQNPADTTKFQAELSRLSGASSPSTGAPGGFRLLRFSGFFSKQEVQNPDDPSQNITAISIGGEIAIQKKIVGGSSLEIGAGFEVQSGIESSLSIMGNVAYKSATGEFIGRGSLYLNFTKEEYSGNVGIATKVFGKSGVKFNLGFYYNNPKNEFAFNAGTEIPDIWLPNINCGIQFYAGNAIQKRFPASLVNNGIFLEVNFFYGWEFKRSIGIAAVEAKFEVYAGGGVGYDFDRRIVPFKVGIGASIGAQLSLFGFDVAGISAKLSLDIVGQGDKGIGVGRFKLQGHINCSNCGCNSRGLINDGPGAKGCIDGAIGVRVDERANPKWKWYRLGGEEDIEKFLAGNEKFFQEQDKELPKSPVPPLISRVNTEGFNKFTAYWQEGIGNPVKIKEYRVQVSESSDFKPLLFDYSRSKNSELHTITGEGGKAYYVRARAVSQEDEKLVSLFSEAKVFQMPAPPIPKLTPFTNATFTGFTANWEDVKDEIGYEVQYSSEANFKTSYTARADANATSLVIDKDIEEGKIFQYYRVRALFSGNIHSVYSLPEKATLPLRKLTAIEANNIDYAAFTARWKKAPHCLKYVVHLSKSEDFSEQVWGYPIEIKDNSAESTLIGKPDLSNLYPYYYKIEALYESENKTPMSDPIKVQLKRPTPPVISRLSTDYVNQVTIDFDGEAEVLKREKIVYIQYEISSSPDFSQDLKVYVNTKRWEEKVKSENMSGDFYSKLLYLTGMLSNTKYYIRARAGISAENYSEYGPTITFSTPPVSIAGKVSATLSNDFKKITIDVEKNPNILQYTIDIYRNESNIGKTDGIRKFVGSRELPITIDLSEGRTTSPDCSQPVVSVRVTPNYYVRTFSPEKRARGETGAGGYSTDNPPKGQTDPTVGKNTYSEAKTRAEFDCDKQIKAALDKDGFKQNGVGKRGDLILGFKTSFYDFIRPEMQLEISTDANFTNYASFGLERNAATATLMNKYMVKLPYTSDSYRSGTYLLSLYGLPEVSTIYHYRLTVFSKNTGKSIVVETGSFRVIHY